MRRKQDEWKRGSRFVLLLLLILFALSPANLAQPGLPVLSINDVILAEDSCQGKSFVFTVTLSHLGRAPVTVNYATSDGSPSGIGAAAVAGNDYVATSGTLTFDHSTPPNGPRGSDIRTIAVPLGDYVVSTGGIDERSFTVTLNGATNATISRAQGTGTLLDAATNCAPAHDAGCFVNFCGATTACKNVNRSATATPYCQLALEGDFGACNAAGLWRDTDGDGLSDAAEAQGYIDVDANGIYDPGIDIPLPGADPNKADVYLHYDYVIAGDHTHQPPADAMQWIVDAFAAHGINLHIDPQHNAICENAGDAGCMTVGTAGRVAHLIPGDTFPARDCEDPSGCPTPVSACVGPSAVSPRQMREATPYLSLIKPAYHYMIFGHYSGCPSDDAGLCANCPTDQEIPACGALVAGPPQPGNLGTAEIFGNDAIVATQPLVDAGIVPNMASVRVEWWAGLGMHEFGHNLGLLHGGQDCFNNKPNYVSVMSHSFFLNGIPVAASPGDTVPQSCNIDSDCVPGHGSRAHCSVTTHTCFRIDYSDRRFNDLDEGGLDETLGLEGGADNTDISWRRDPRGSSFIRTPTNGSPIDWNGDGAIESSVVEEINRDGQKTLLAAQNDWEIGPDSSGHAQFKNLHFAYQCSSNFSDAAPNQALGGTGFERLFREAWLRASSAQPAGSWMSNTSLRLLNRPQTVPLRRNPEHDWLRESKVTLPFGQKAAGRHFEHDARRCGSRWRSGKPMDFMNAHQSNTTR